MTSSNAPEPGTMLAGKYRVENVLGVGGMGAVVAAYHVDLDQKVAIKYLLPSALANPEVVERFAREAKAAAKIRGEHVARVIDVGKFDDGSPFMVMEYLEGHDLAKQLEKDGPLPIEQAVRFVLEACEALAEAHAAKIVHRDLKPSNLFLAKQPDKRSIIKVLDFGISKLEGAQSAALTKTSALMGTAFYMSPEQLMSPKNVDQRSDIWALGVILYELLGGRPPFLGESVPEIIGAILSNEPDGLGTLRPDIPLDLQLVIARCMQTKVDARYTNVAQLAAALAPFAAVPDRMSVEITARVLGESLRPAATASAPSAGEAPGNATLVVPSGSVAKTTGPAAVVDKSTAVITSSGAGQSGAPRSTSPATPAPVTNIGLSTSVLEQKKSRLPMVGVAVVLIAGVAGGVVALTRSSNNGGTTGPVSGGIVGTVAEPSAPATPSAAPPATQAQVPAATAAPVTSIAATPGAASAVAPVVMPASNTSKPIVNAVAKPTATGHAVAPATTAAASAHAQAAPTAPSAAAAPAQPTTTSSASKNPLQMGIK